MIFLCTRFLLSVEKIIDGFDLNDFPSILVFVIYGRCADCLFVTWILNH